MTVAGESSGVTDPAELITTLLGLAGTATVFFKETTDRRHHAVLADRRLLTEATHTFLIRAPAEIVASHYALQSAGRPCSGHPVTAMNGGQAPAGTSGRAPAAVAPVAALPQ